MSIFCLRRNLRSLRKFEKGMKGWYVKCTKISAVTNKISTQIIAGYVNVHLIFLFIFQTNARNLPSKQISVKRFMKHLTLMS